MKAARQFALGMAATIHASLHGLPELVQAGLGVGRAAPMQFVAP